MENKDSHKQILKSTGIVGGAQVISIIIGIIRTKVAAVLLGPSGIGIIGILQSAIDLVRSFTGFGINFSGVKDIAESSDSREQERINRTITIVRRWALGTGVLGMLVTVFFCIPLSNYSFGNDSYALGFSILSITLLITSISAGQLALLQGLRRIKELAKATLLGSVLGTVITLPLYWWLGRNGIIPGMIITSLGSFFVSWLYARKVKVVKLKISVAETFSGGLSMARLGFFIVMTSFIAAATMYLTRAFIVSKLNIEAVGHFQASWMISKTYIGIVLNAMLADFFPRLSGINKNNIASNKLINEQLEMTLVIGIPMLIVLCAYANFVIFVLYSSSFLPSVSLLQWQTSGSFFTLISWPLGVMFLAKGKGLYCIINDSVWSLVYMGCIYWGWSYWGFNVLGIAFFIASAVNLIFVIIFVRRLGQFSFTKTNTKFIIYGFIAISIVFINVMFVSSIFQFFISLIIVIIGLWFALIQLKKVLDVRDLHQLFKKILNR